MRKRSAKTSYPEPGLRRKNQSSKKTVGDDRLFLYLKKIYHLDIKKKDEEMSKGVKKSQRRDFTSLNIGLRIMSIM